MRLVGIALIAGFVLMFTLILTTGASAQRPLPKRTSWWNDPMIVKKLTLTDGQRQKMNALFVEYDKSGPRRPNVVTQKPYLEALEKGDWALAQKEIDRWLVSDEQPKRAMAELKVKILPLMSDEQRALLKQHYPRIIRRTWIPAARWGDTRPGGPKPKKPKLPNKKP
jgi:Spy/CpxP family protein refolding chaperone